MEVPKALHHGYYIANQTLGILGASCRKNVMAIISQFISHMKASLNRNSQDLELVIAMDISFEMKPSFEVLKNQMGELKRSIGKIRESGRKVRLGFMTYSDPEEIPLLPLVDLSEDFNDMDLLLDEIVTNYHRNDDHPGYANHPGVGAGTYSALLTITDEFQWQSPNRKIIYISDSEVAEFELFGEPDTAITTQKLAGYTVYPLIVKSCEN